MTAEDFIKGQLVLFAWREGHSYGGVDNMLAVLFVLRNRQRAGWHGGDWLKIVERHDDAAAYGPLELARTQVAGARLSGSTVMMETIERLARPQFPDLRIYEMQQKLLPRVDDIFSGMAPDVYTEDKALYYAELNGPLRERFKSEVCSRPVEHPRVAQVGPVFFFA